MAPRKLPVASKTSTIAKVQQPQSIASLSQADRNPQVLKPLLLEASHSFTQSQLALALTIQKSKPADISTRDYCIQIQQNVKVGWLPDHEEHRYIDSPEFWKSQYTKLYSKKIQLEVEVCRLERLHNQYQRFEAAQKAAEEEVPIETSRSHKRKTPPSFRQAVHDLFDAQLTPDADMSSVSCSIAYLPLLKHAQVLYRLLQDSKVPTDTLLSSLQASISYMTTIIGGVFKRSIGVDQSNKESVVRNAREAFTVVAAVFKICLQGLAHLCRDITGRRCKGQVIHALVKLFDAVILNTNHLCKQSGESDKAVIQCIQTRLRPRQDQNRQCNDKFSFVSPFAKLLANILLCPELLEPNCSTVLEGLLCILLTRIGQLLSETVFKEQISSSNLPGGISSTEIPKVSPEQNIAVQLEGQCLAWVLEETLKRRDMKERHAILVLIMGQKSSPISPTNGVLLEKARRRLQDTLLTGVFGSLGDDFMTNLKRLEVSGDDCGSEAAAFERDVPFSFVESIWSTIGWEFLGS